MTETVNHTEEITLQAQFMKISIKGTIEHDSQHKKMQPPDFMKLPQESTRRKERCLHMVESSVPIDDQQMEDTWKGEKNDCTTDCILPIFSKHSNIMIADKICIE